MAFPKTREEISTMTTKDLAVEWTNSNNTEYQEAIESEWLKRDLRENWDGVSNPGPDSIHYDQYLANEEEKVERMVWAHEDYPTYEGDPDALPGDQ